LRAVGGTSVYRGRDNTLSLLTSGVSPECITATASAGTVSKKGGDLLLSVGTGDTTTVTVTSSGEGCPAFEKAIDLTVIPLPAPAPHFAGLSYGDDKVKKSSLTAAQGVAAKGPAGLADVKYTVTRFSLTMIVGGTPIEKVSKSTRVTSDMKTMLKKAKPGTTIFIHKIQATSPDGAVHALGALSFKVM
jgi:hypothetical protein